jgi:hypothetical protein
MNEPNRYRVTIPGRHDLIIGHVYNRQGDGWMYQPLSQTQRSRRLWPTPQAALARRVKNYDLVAPQD